MAPWSKQKIAALRRLVIAGRTQSQIGHMLGMTPRAVQSKISRLKLSRLRPMIRERRPARPPQPYPTMPAAAHALAPIYPPLNVRLGDARSNQCRWVTSKTKGSGADTLICGQPTFSRSWCAYHHSIGRRHHA